MKTLLQIKIIDNQLGGHRDLHFTVDGLVDEIFDTYYFIIAIEPVKSLNNIETAVSRLLSSWHRKMIWLKENKTIYLPIDFSDQYTGCLQVHRRNDLIDLKYGLSNREGYTISPIDPEDFYEKVNDFQSDGKNIVVGYNDFLMAIENQIEQLTKGG